MRQYLPLIILAVVLVTAVVTVYKLRDRFQILGEFITFLGERKMLWIAPFVIVFVLAGLLVIITGHSAMAFIYTLF